MSEKRSCIVVPAFATRTASEQVELARCFLTAYPGGVSALSVVEVPEDRSLSEGALVVRRRRALLRKLTHAQGDDRLFADVRTAHSWEEGIRETMRDVGEGLLLLSWNPRHRYSSERTIEALVADPPSDLAVVKLGDKRDVGSIVVPARGGPQARLAVRLAETVAKETGGVLTLLHIVSPHWSSRRRAREERFFDLISADVDHDRVRQLSIENESVEAALIAEGGKHDMVVMGAGASDDVSAYLLGRIPTQVARKLACTVVIVKTREPITRNTFRLPEATDPTGAQDISEVVDRWFAQNTFHSHEFRWLGPLLELKERRGTAISLVLPTLNEEKTVGNILATIKRHLVDRYPLIDELLVIDSASEDRTVDIVTSMGIPVLQHREILPQFGTFAGKGEALWKSLYVTSGDIIVWIDSDISGIHPKFVYGLVGPLLTQPDLGFVKGFYRRPLNLGGGQQATTGGGRVTELTARPLINLFYPQLSGLVQPLAGEMAGYRRVLEAVPFFTGYGVETGLLIDILEQFGLRVIAQTDLEERIHRNQSLLSLSKMANAIVQVVIKRLGDRNRLRLLEDVNTSMKLIHYAPKELFLEVKDIREYERPPIKSLSEYADRSTRR